MTWFVKRDSDGNITGVFANRQDNATEQLADGDAALLAFQARAMPAVLDGTVFLSRITDTEYVNVVAAAQSNVAIARWIETLRMLGVVDLNSATAQAAKTGLVALGLLTQPRADVVFSL